MTTSTLSAQTRRALESALTTPSAQREVKGILNSLANGIADVEISVSAPHTSAVTATIQALNAFGENLTERCAFECFLLADANGDAFSTVDLDSTAIATDGALLELVTDKVFLVITEADGSAAITFTEATATGTIYLAVKLPSGKMVISGAITFT